MYTFSTTIIQLIVAAIISYDTIAVQRGEQNGREYSWCEQQRNDDNKAVLYRIAGDGVEKKDEAGVEQKMNRKIDKTNTMGKTQHGIV